MYKKQLELMAHQQNLTSFLVVKHSQLGMVHQGQQDAAELRWPGFWTKPGEVVLSLYQWLFTI